MKTFEIEVKEKLSKVLEIESNTFEEAINKAKQKYYNEEIILDYKDNVETEFDIVNFKTMESDGEFSDFVLRSAEKTISQLSVRELAILAFGDFTSAVEEFNSRDRRDQ